MTGPVVSVIIPARDAAPTLERTLAALSDQTIGADFEVVVVDDGSRDRTPEIARAHGSFVRLVSNPESLGPGAARSRGEAASVRQLAARARSSPIRGPRGSRASKVRSSPRRSMPS